MKDKKTLDLENRIYHAKKLGYNIYYYYSGEENDCIKFLIDRAETVMIAEARNKLENCICKEFIRMSCLEFKYALRRYDYRETAMNENAKSTVIFLAVLIKVIMMLDERNKHIKDLIEDMLTKFTEDECSFYDLVSFNWNLAEGNISDDFSDACMDYIANILLKYGY